MHRTRRAFSGLIAVAIAVSTLVTGQDVAAQGTSGALPGPVDSAQLARYAETLGLTDEQRIAFEAAHDDYRRDFRLLRDGEIAVFLKEQAGMQGGLPERGAAEKLLDDWKRLGAKIAILDNHLLDSLVPMLSGEQLEMLPRLRLARERKRYEPTQMAAGMGRTVVDLSVIVGELDLSTEERESTDVILVPYERKSTAIMRKQGKAYARMTVDLVDQLAERGYSDMSQEKLMQDPELLRNLMTDLQEVYGGIQTDVREHTDDLRELNARAYARLRNILPDDQARTLRNGYFRGSYGQLGSIANQADTDWITKALRIDDLTPEQREVLALAATKRQRDFDKMLADGAGILDAFWADFSPFDMAAMREKGEQLGKDLGELYKQTETSRTEAEGQIEASLGSIVLNELRAKAAALGSKTARADADESDEADEKDDVLDQYAFARDRFVPQRISSRDIHYYMKQLQVTRDLGDVVDEIHVSYLERLRDEPVFAELRDMRYAARNQDDESDVDNETRIENVYKLRRRAIKSMAAADSVFFDDLALLVGDEKRSLLERVRLSRLREGSTSRANRRFMLGRDQSQESSLDVVSIVLEEQPTDDELALIEEILSGYESAATTAFRARLEAQLRLQKITDLWRLEIDEASREDIVAVVELQNRYREAMKEPSERVRGTDRTIIDLNQAALDELVAALPAGLAEDIRHAYEEAAFPSVYTDPAAVDKQLTKALELRDLSAQQRDSVSDLAMTYRTDYERLSRDMIRHIGPSPVSYVGIDPENWREWQQQQQQLAKIRFDRNELNGRAISRLRTALTDEQVRMIGGLPEPPGEDDEYWYR